MCWPPPPTESGGPGPASASTMSIFPAATAAGVIVMNTPFGNSITNRRARHRPDAGAGAELPAANASTQAGKWEKNRFMGVEITGKVLGLIGAGISQHVGDRAAA